MKKLLLSMCLFLSAMLTFGQTPGLVNVLVEQIPVSATVQAADPNLNANSVTYRVFVQMEPGYAISTVQGLFANPLLFKTSTQFYNNEDGDVNPLFRPIPTMDEALYYDSWITIGAYGKQAASSQLVPLSEDISDGVQDGIVLGAVTNATALDPATDFELIWGYEMGPSADFGTPGYDPENVIYYAAGGVPGITASNSVCIGQWTTDGDFTFELGFQLIPTSGDAVNYVYRDASVPGDFTQSDLCFFTTVNDAPLVSLTAPLPGDTYIAGDPVDMSANASDPDGSISKVEFLVDDVVVGEDIDGAPFELPIPWSSTTGNKSLTAKAYDNFGKSTTSDAVAIIVNDPPANELPVATINAPAEGDEYDVKDAPHSATINWEVDASDADGSVTLVEFYANGNKLGDASSTGASGSYELTWETGVIGNYELTAIATDDLGVKGPASAPVNVRVFNSGVSFQLGNQRVDSVVCHSSSVFCVPVKRINSDVTDATGFDFELEYDETLVTPTGKVYASNDMTNERQTGTYFRQEGTNKAYVGVYFVKGNATFNGQGEILCVEFARNVGFVTGERAEIELTSIITSYSGLPAVVENLPDPYTYTIYNNTVFEGSLSFWADDSPIRGGVGYAETEIKSVDSAYSEFVDENGNFIFDINRGGKKLRITKTNPGAPSDWNDPVKTKELWSSYDALLTQKVIVNDPTFIPNVFQIIAMDVNRDQVVTAGDITQIMRRSVETINNFTQISYARRWEWLNVDALNSDLGYRISLPWGTDDGIGYSKNRVPLVDRNFVIDAGDDDANCALMESMNFKGILLGDVDGSYHAIIADGIRKSTSIKKSTEAGEMVLLDLAKATFEENYVNIPVRLYADESVEDLDLVLSYNGEKLFHESVVSHSEFILLESNVINNKHLSIGSIGTKSYPVDQKLFTLRFYVNGEFSKQDILGATSFIRGVKVETNISSPTAVDDNFELMLKVYPNPAKDMLKVELPENAKIELMSITGKVLYSNLNTNGLEVINVQELSNGIYMLKVSNDRISTVRQIVIQK